MPNERVRESKRERKREIKKEKYRVLLNNCKELVEYAPCWDICFVQFWGVLFRHNFSVSEMVHDYY